MATGLCQRGTPYGSVCCGDDLNPVVKCAFDYAREGDRKSLMDLLQQFHIPLDVPLLGAAAGGHEELTYEIASLGANDLDGALQMAAYMGHGSLVDQLLVWGAGNPSDGILSAIDGGHYELARELWSNDTQLASLLDEALYQAAKVGDRELVDFFLDQGSNNYTAVLTGAAEGGHLDLVKDIAKIPDVYLEEGLSMASASGAMDVVRFLIDQGAMQINWALAEATNAGQEEIAAYLRQLGAVQTLPLDFMVDLPKVYPGITLIPTEGMTLYEGLRQFL